MKKQIKITQRRLKIILDIILFLMSLTIFSKQLISMRYHEIAGLLMIVLIILHIALNIKTVKGMCKKFIKVPVTVKAGLITDILLLVCFALIGISGILISHTILTEISSDNMFFKLSHMFAGGLSVILLGIHIGLHICRKSLPIIAAIAVSVTVFCCGIYGAANSSMGRWLSIPFTVSEQTGKANGNNGHTSYNNSGVQEKMIQNDKHQNNVGEKGAEGRNRQTLPFSQKMQIIIMFMGMILSCAMITYWVAIPRKKEAIQDGQ